jgi:glycosyltransferase involved in cell wall biosynthesis
MLETAAAVVVNSHDTATRFAAYAHAARRPLPPIAVAALGVTSLPPPGPAPLDRPYFVVVGTIEPRKNHAFLLQVWRRLAMELGAATPMLVLIGRRGWECEHVVDFLERCPETRRHVREVSDADDAQLAGWLAHARALLFPTFAEGYGLPVIEALSAGLPVIASDLSVFREVVGDIPDYLDPLDGPAWQQAVLDYLAPNHTRRLTQLQRMRGFVAPSWDAHFRVVDAIVGPIANSDGRSADPSTGMLEAAGSRP